jgi:uncharacterized protein (TIGR00730 family)
VFAGSECGIHPAYAIAARQIGVLLAEAQIELVFGGTTGGLMGQVADAALERGGTVTGVVSEQDWPELHHTGCTTLIKTADLSARQRKMIRLADGFIVLPGGAGTAYEAAEVIALTRLGLLRKPIGLLSVRGYFAPLLDWHVQMYREGFVGSNLLGEYLLVEQEPDALMRLLLADERWLFSAPRMGSRREG